MSILVLDEHTCDRLLAERTAMGRDRYDEVWEGTYILYPPANLEHQHLVSELNAILREAIWLTGKGRVYPGANVTDDATDWKFNFRCPDVVVVLNEGRAQSISLALVGGPDFLIEIMSPGDRSLDKLPFYSQIGVRELLTVERDSKHLELFRLQGEQLVSTGHSTPADPATLKSDVVPLTFAWLLVEERAGLFVTRTDGQPGEWRI